jgi:hypothetical protein
MDQQRIKVGPFTWEEDQARVIEEHWESVLDEVAGVDLSIG